MEILNDISSDDDENKSTNEVIISDDIHLMMKINVVVYYTTFRHSILTITLGVDIGSQHTMIFIIQDQKCSIQYNIERPYRCKHTLFKRTNEVKEGEMRLKLANHTSNVVKVRGAMHPLLHNVL